MIEPLRFLDLNPELRTVYLVSRWARYASEVRFKHQTGTPSIHLSDTEDPDFTPVGNAPVFARALKRTIEAFEARGIKVVVLTQVPDIAFQTSVAMGMSRHLGRNIDLRTSRAEYEDHIRSTTAQFAPYVAARRITLLPLGELMCDGPMCRIATSAGLPAYWDSNHLSKAGAQDLIGPVTALLRQ